MARIEAISDVPSLMKFVVNEQKVGGGSISGFSIGPDDKQSTVNIANFSQTGIGLPERDYYFKTDSSIIVIQKAYKKYLTRLFELTGTDTSDAEKYSEVAFDIEKQLATSHRTNVELRDVKAN